MESVRDGLLRRPFCSHANSCRWIRNSRFVKGLTESRHHYFCQKIYQYRGRMDVFWECKNLLGLPIIFSSGRCIQSALWTRWPSASESCQTTTRYLPSLLREAYACSPIRWGWEVSPDCASKNLRRDENQVRRRNKLARENCKGCGLASRVRKRRRGRGRSGHRLCVCEAPAGRT